MNPPVFLFLASILPPILSPLLLKLFYSFFSSSRPTNPSAVNHHRKLAITFLIISYLFYNLTVSVQTNSESAFSILDVKLDSTYEEKNLGGVFPVRAKEVTSGGPKDVVKTAYRKLAKAFHPDKLKNPTEEQMERWMKIQVNYNFFIPPVSLKKLMLPT
jgi:hypothetical protein